MSNKPQSMNRTPSKWWRNVTKVASKHKKDNKKAKILTKLLNYELNEVVRHLRKLLTE